MTKRDIFLWLDDMRPAPDGFTWAKTVEEAQWLTETGNVVFMSLDHDLGACDKCLEGQTPEAWLERHEFQSMPNCTHLGTGYTFLCWLEENRLWPIVKPCIHSANPVGAKRMRQVVDKYYDKEERYNPSSYDR